VAIRVNPDRPETRRRFSIGHEIAHTFFPTMRARRGAGPMLVTAVAITQMNTLRCSVILVQRNCSCPVRCSLRTPHA
jgi:hypothetical protein